GSRPRGARRRARADRRDAADPARVHRRRDRRLAADSADPKPGPQAAGAAHAGSRAEARRARGARTPTRLRRRLDRHRHRAAAPRPLSDGSSTLLRTVAFAELDASVWGAAWSSTPDREGFVAVGGGERSGAASARLSAADDDAEWLLQGADVELTVSPASAAVAT